MVDTMVETVVGMFSNVVVKTMIETVVNSMLHDIELEPMKSKRDNTGSSNLSKLTLSISSCLPVASTDKQPDLDSMVLIQQWVLLQFITLLISVSSLSIYRWNDITIVHNVAG